MEDNKRDSDVFQEKRLIYRDANGNLWDEYGTLMVLIQGGRESSRTFEKPLCQNTVQGMMVVEKKGAKSILDSVAFFVYSQARI
jgi:hypothetical protein